MNTQRELSATYQHNVTEFVNREVYYCASYLISELASNEKYMEELWPVLSTEDYESAAYDEGYRVKFHHGFWVSYRKGNFQSMREAIELDSYESEAEAWRDQCDASSIEPYQREAYEHWIVSEWLAGELEERGEMILRDFLGLTIWGRCTTGQAIMLDSVICSIYDDCHKS